MERPDLSKKVVKRIFPTAVEDVWNGLCPTCQAEIKEDEFRDALSIKEYSVSGMCQKCQDSVFGKGG